MAHVPLLHKKLLVRIAGGDVVALAGARRLNREETSAVTTNRTLNRHPMESPSAVDPLAAGWPVP
jgi:hypothetical protein